MEIRVVIKKSYVFVLVALVALVGFVIAQTTPNPGHAVIEVPGAARNCISNPSAACNTALSTSGWNSWEVTSQAALSYDSLRFGNLLPSQYCKTSGLGCDPDLVWKEPSTASCSGMAFYCGAHPVSVSSYINPQGNIINTVTPVTPVYTYTGNPSWRTPSGQDCVWVLCKGYP